jgi:hypothetical protein
MGNLKTGFWVTLGVMAALLVIGLVMGVFTK